jgi:hypothetical protein
MESLTQVVRSLSWHIKGQRHLFIPPNEYDETKVRSALYLVEAFQEQDIKAKMLMGEGWGLKMPLDWPEEWFIRTIAEAELYMWDKVWLWGMTNTSNHLTDRRGKSAVRTSSLRHIISMSKDIIQIIGLYDEKKSKPRRIVVDSELPTIDYQSLDLKCGYDKKFNAKLRDALTEQIRTYISYRVGEFNGHKRHYFETYGTGGLVELTYYLALELGSHGSGHHLREALKNQIEQFPYTKEDPMIITFLNMLESKC